MKAKSNNYRGRVDISVSQNFITSKNTIYKYLVIEIVLILSITILLLANLKKKRLGGTLENEKIL